MGDVTFDVIFFVCFCFHSYCLICKIFHAQTLIAGYT